MLTAIPQLSYNVTRVSTFNLVFFVPPQSLLNSYSNISHLKEAMCKEILPRVVVVAQFG